MTTATVAVGNRNDGHRNGAAPGAAWRSWSTGSSRRCSERRRRSRARRRPSTRLGGSGRPGTWTAGWQSSPAWTWRRRRRGRLAGPSPSGRRWSSGGSETGGRWSTARARGGPPPWFPTATGCLRWSRSWGCAGGPARCSRGAACGVCGPPYRVRGRL